MGVTWTGDIENKIIGNPHETNGKQLLLIKSDDPNQKKELLAKSKNLLSSLKDDQLFLQDDLTKAEEIQFQLRKEMCEKKLQHPVKCFRI